MMDPEGDIARFIRDCVRAEIERQIAALRAPTKRGPWRKNAEFYAKLRELAAQGKTASGIAVELNLPYNTVYDMARRLGIELPRKGNRAKLNAERLSQHERRKAADAAAAQRLSEIVEMRKRGMRMAEIGLQFNVTRERIRQLLIKHGDPELLGAAVTRVNWTCPICGRHLKLWPKAAIRKSTCSRACTYEAARRSMTPETRELCRGMVEARMKGATWPMIADQFMGGKHSDIPNAFYRVRRYLYAIDASPEVWAAVFPRGQSNPKMPAERPTEAGAPDDAQNARL